MKNFTERRKDAGEMRVKDEMLHLVRDSSACESRGTMLRGGYGLDGQYGLNGRDGAVGLNGDRRRIPQVRLIAKVYFPWA